MQQWNRCLSRSYVVSVCVGLILTGCATSGALMRRLVPPGGASSQRLIGIDTSQAAGAADRAFRQYFQVNRDASGPNLWVSRATEMTKEEKKEHSLARRSQRHRRIAELELLPQGNDVVVRCQVRIERFSSTERAAFAGQRGDDRPTETPIDHMHGGSTRRQEEWVRAGRDRRTEQLILGSIGRSLGIENPRGFPSSSPSS